MNSGLGVSQEHGRGEGGRTVFLAEGAECMSE